MPRGVSKKPPQITHHSEIRWEVLHESFYFTNLNSRLAEVDHTSPKNCQSTCFWAVYIHLQSPTFLAGIPKSMKKWVTWHEHPSKVVEKTKNVSNKNPWHREKKVMKTCSNLSLTDSSSSSDSFTTSWLQESFSALNKTPFQPPENERLEPKNAGLERFFSFPTMWCSC